MAERVSGGRRMLLAAEGAAIGAVLLASGGLATIACGQRIQLPQIPASEPTTVKPSENFGPDGTRILNDIEISDLKRAADVISGVYQLGNPYKSLDDWIKAGNAQFLPKKNNRFNFNYRSSPDQNQQEIDTFTPKNAAAVFRTKDNEIIRMTDLFSRYISEDGKRLFNNIGGEGQFVNKQNLTQAEQFQLINNNFSIPPDYKIHDVLDAGNGTTEIIYVNAGGDALEVDISADGIFNYWFNISFQ